MLTDHAGRLSWSPLQKVLQKTERRSTTRRTPVMRTAGVFSWVKYNAQCGHPCGEGGTAVGGSGGARGAAWHWRGGRRSAPVAAAAAARIIKNLRWKKPINLLLRRMDAGVDRRLLTYLRAP